MFTDAEQRALRCIDADELVEWTRALVRIPSVYRPERGEAEEAAAQWVLERFAELGLVTEWQMVAPGRPNVIGVLRGREGGRCLMFEGHTDVVTEGDAQAWLHPPFAAEVEGGRIYGRGVNDMKGGLVAAIAATKAIRASGVPFRGDILVGALADEEGQMLGVKHFVESAIAKRVSAAIICEPEDNHICIAQKGAMRATVRLNGKMAHGCMPLTGINPIYQAVKLLTAVRALEEQEIHRYGRHPFLGQPSITPTIIHAPVRGESQVNVVPAQCDFTLDLRLLPEQSDESLEGSLREIIARLRSEDHTFSAELDIIERRPATATAREEPVVMALDGAYRDIAGKEPVYAGVPGSTDGTILFGRLGIPIVTCGPGDTFIPHHVDEYLDIDQLVEATKLYVVAALRYLGT